MRRWLARWGFTIAVAVVAVCVLAIVGAYALAQVTPKQSGLAVAIAIPAGVIIFAALIWLGRQKR